MATHASTYQLSRQIGFNLRRANQRHLTIFANHIQDFTPTQFAALAKLFELGPISQNELGRRTSMDAATIKGVVDRLKARDMLATARDSVDQRRLVVQITEFGRQSFIANVGAAEQISAQTLAPLTPEEAVQLLSLIEKIT